MPGTLVREQPRRQPAVENYCIIVVHLEIFASVTLSTNRHCYVTNVVKRRPLNNRDPTAREIEWYRGYLREEIRLLDPAIIVCTGRHSMRTLLGKNCEGITKIRGRWFDVDGRVVPHAADLPLLRDESENESEIVSD